MFVYRRDQDRMNLGGGDANSQIKSKVNPRINFEFPPHSQLQGIVPIHMRHVMKI